MFYKHPALENVRWYWRVEPKVQFFCNVDYDVFRYMQDQNKTYGFTINLFDAPETIPTLWPETERFIAAHPEYLQDNNMVEWLVDDKLRPEHNKKANGYSTCHFWSNFEIGDMDFFRGEAYEAYFNHLDRAGGFFYERWGDAPIHSIALGLFEDASKIHWLVFCCRVSSIIGLTDICCSPGSVISGTVTSPTSTAQTLQNVLAATRANFTKESPSSPKKIADPITSNMWERIDSFIPEPRRYLSCIVRRQKAFHRPT